MNDGINWFVKTLEKEFLVAIDGNQISFEGHELYLDEIDESLVPKEMLKGFPDSILVETMLFDDRDEIEWIGMVVEHPESRKWLLQVLLKDGEPVLRKRVQEEK
ncbi:hypothetical protein [Metabacillus fastidiosus]|uniref:hypothetical protein n=1 Tax=Metabacillus fastidiosus TaxID=1458 RepID=UPI00082488F1|nr:hypothetical protein [Metabacillus fastidiosus]MED4464483.1 hypothetical protein [Metabacillus fastidiosus]